MVRPLHIRNATFWGARPFEHGPQQGDLFVAERVQSAPAPDALAVDASDLTIFPGLVNAHDHLELNHFPRTKFRECYDNAHQWGEDVSARLDESPFRELRAAPLGDRLFVGGIKNLLCGATTVAHHNPPHRALFRRDFPVRVVRRYGWAHSLHFSSEDDIRASYAATPPDAPWLIHLAEGTDAQARAEFARLKALGCVGPNTVLIHGVGIDPVDLHDEMVSLVWCPSSNRFLLDATLPPAILTEQRRVALGSDSRLTADGDLLDEMRATWDACLLPQHAETVLAMVTYRPAEILRLPDVGHLGSGAQGDLIALRGNACPADLCHARRADLALVVTGGIPRIGDADVMARFASMPTVAAELDGRPKAIHRALARRLAYCTIKEPGLSVDVDALKPRRRLFRWI